MVILGNARSKDGLYTLWLIWLFERDHFEQSNIPHPRKLQFSGGVTIQRSASAVFEAQSPAKLLFTVVLRLCFAVVAFFCV